MPLAQPRHRIVIDWETYYDEKYSLKNMTTQEYIADERFAVIGLSFQLDEREPVYMHADETRFRAVIDALPWDEALVVAHNAQFDGAILEWVYGKKPAMYFCTMQAANAVSKPFNGSASLAKTAEYYNLPPKGSFITNMRGKHLSDLSPLERDQMKEYGTHDTRLCGWIHERQRAKLPQSELVIIDLTIRKFVRRLLRLDAALIAADLARVEQRKAEVLSRFGSSPEEIKSTLMSNPKFAQALQHLGVSPPTKVSARTNKLTYAFAKSDAGMQALLEHPDEAVQLLAAARLETKSTLEETRLGRFLRLAQTGQPLGIPLNYYGAHTGRFSGADSLNFQNLPRNSALRYAVVAPPGYKVITADFSQIECRVLACVAGEMKLIRAFACGEDVYCDFAGRIFHRVVTKANHPMERHLGKTSVLGLGFGTGAAKFYDTVKSQGIPITEQSAKAIVRLYRDTYSAVPRLWDTCENMLTTLMSMEGVDDTHRAHKVFTEIGLVAAPGRIELPNGMCLHYPDLQYRRTSDAGSGGMGLEWTYKVPKRGGASRTTLYGAKIVEHLCQSLARIIMTGAELALAKHGLFAVMTVHDELIYVVREEVVDNVVKALRLAMTTPPPWMPNLPLACDIGVGNSYGEAGADK